MTRYRVSVYRGGKLVWDTPRYGSKDPEIAKAAFEREMKKELGDDITVSCSKEE